MNYPIAILSNPFLLLVLYLIVRVSSYVIDNPYIECWVKDLRWRMLFFCGKWDAELVSNYILRRIVQRTTSFKNSACIQYVGGAMKIFCFIRRKMLVSENWNSHKSEPFSCHFRSLADWSAESKSDVWVFSLWPVDHFVDEFCIVFFIHLGCLDLNEIKQFRLFHGTECHWMMIRIHDGQMNTFDEFKRRFFHFDLGFYYWLTTRSELTSRNEYKNLHIVALNRGDMAKEYDI